MIKNSTNQHISFLMLSATDGSGVNTGTTFVAICKDGGGPVTATNSPVHRSNGAWTLDLSQAETNCDHLLAVMTISGAITAMVQVYPVDPASFKADVSSLATSTEIADIKGAGWSASTDTLELIRDRVDLGITLTASQNDFDPTTDTVANVTTVGSVTNAVTTSNASDVTAIKGVTDKLDTTWQVNGAVYKFTTDALSNGPTGGSAPSAADIYSEFTTGTNADAFKSDVTALATTAQLNALNNISANDVYLEFVSGTNADAFKANVSALSTSAEIASLNDLSVSDVENAIWDADYTNHTTTNTFGDKVLLAQSSHRLVQVDANHNVHSAVHVMEIDSFTAAAIATDAVTELQSGLATAVELATVPKINTAYTHTNQAGDTMTVTIS